MPITEAITTAGIQGFSGLITKLAAEHAARMASPERAVRIKTDLTPHIEATYKRCSVIKTLLNPNEPAPFLNVYATQRFKKSGNIVDQYDLVEWIRGKNNNAIITGTGGSGKSMFMRYLWLSLFVNSEGRIPIFIELRAMNSVTKPDLEEFLYQTLTTGKASISRRDFNKNLSNGNFIIVLDGFDELAVDRREEIQHAILSLSETYSDTKIVISGRPDERFSAWNSFHVVNVASLQKTDVVELIGKAPFDSGPRDKFLKQVKSTGFFETHKDFLSSPLLASMMLLTFSYNFDIPDRMHLFYDQAFDALYQRHDAHKPGGYKRIFNCDISEDVFKRVFSYFCLLTYYEQQFEFDKNSLISYVYKAISIEKLDIDSEKYVDDLVNCVCVIVKDGITYSFAHRSFQEFFSAYCMAYVTTKNIRKIVRKFIARPTDQAVTLLADMNPEVFREEILIPFSDEFSDDMQVNARSRSLPKFLLGMDRQFQVHWLASKKQPNPIITFVGTSPFSDFVGLLDKIAGRDRDTPAEARRRETRDLNATTNIKALIGADDMASLSISGGESAFKFAYLNAARDKFVPAPDVDGKMNEEFRKSGMYDFLGQILRTSVGYIRNSKSQSGATSNAMEELFGD